MPMNISRQKRMEAESKKIEELFHGKAEMLVFERWS